MTTMETKLHKKMESAWKCMKLLKDSLTLETSDLECSFGNYVKIENEWKKQNYPIPTFYIRGIGEHIQKGISLDEIKGIVYRKNGRIKETGLIDLQWLIGLPGEDTQTMGINLNAMFNLIMKGKVRSITPNVLGPQPGSDIGDYPEKYGITIHHRRWPHYYSNGAYPSFSTKTVTSDQIYVYYLMAKMIVSEALQIRPVYEQHNVEPIIWGPEITLFKEFMQQVGS